MLVLNRKNAVEKVMNFDEEKIFTGKTFKVDGDRVAAQAVDPSESSALFSL